MEYFVHIFLLCMVLLHVHAFTVANLVPSLQSSSWLDHERSALLQFKHSLRTDCTAFDYPPSPKMDSWIGGENADHCSWDGVKCGKTTGHVIGLSIGWSCIRGTFPPNSSLFSLTHLQRLDLSCNDFNNSRIPSKISMLTNLISLRLTLSSFCCQIPTDISKLWKLKVLDISFNSFSGSIPSSFGNLTMLTTLTLSGLNRTGKLMPGKYSSWLPKLKNLESLDLSFVKLPIKFPSLLVNFTNLKALNLIETQLTNSFPQELANLTNLQTLDLSYNNFEGHIPQWLSRLENLHSLGLSYNNLFGNFDIFSNLTRLRSLGLSGLKLTFSPYSRTNASFLKLHVLGLSSCNLTEFPQFLRDQNELQYLILDENKIEGLIPQWFSNITKENLLDLSLSGNYLTGLEQPVAALRWTRLEMLELAYNKFQGELPALPDSLRLCDISNNILTSLNPTLFCNSRSNLSYLDLSFNKISGEIPDCGGGLQFFQSLQVLKLQNNNVSGVIPHNICHARSLLSLDLSNNNMSGQIPSCFGYQLGNSLLYLNLKNNTFLGTIPQTFTRLCKLHLINLSQNKLHGQLPRSLANCTMLEVFDIGNNQVVDTFPSWLGNHPTLKVLILGHNKFHGSIGEQKSNHDFQFLCILDLSHNQHIDDLPSRYIQNMLAMRDSKKDTPGSYNITYDTSVLLGTSLTYPMTITNKGDERLYVEIPKALRSIDFSSNYFTGRIPDIIGDLKGLQVLNLSNNNLHGEISSSLANIIDLESLDLSRNNLSGTIPQELSQVTSLEVFNVSYNHLMGPVPQGRQFDTFDNTSYEGNPGLCGSPLSKKCKNADSSPPLSPLPSDEGSEDFDEFIDWIIRLLGCISGCIVGFIIGKLYITDKYHEWFVQTFGRQRLPRRVKRAARHKH